MKFKDNYWLTQRRDDGETENSILISDNEHFKALKTVHLVLDEPDCYQVMPMVKVDEWQVCGKGETLDKAIKDCHSRIIAFVRQLKTYKKLLEQHIKEAK